MIGVSDGAITKLAKRGILLPDQTAKYWLLAYCEHIREMAAGRSVDLTAARAAKASEEAQIKKIEKNKLLETWAPIENLTLVLSRVTGQMSSQFDQIPVVVKREWPDVSGEQLAKIRECLAESRNLLVSIGLDAIKNADKRLMDYIDEYDDGSAPQN